MNFIITRLLLLYIQYTVKCLQHFFFFWKPLLLLAFFLSEVSHCIYETAFILTIIFYILMQGGEEEKIKLRTFNLQVGRRLLRVQEVRGKGRDKNLQDVTNFASRRKTKPRLVENKISFKAKYLNFRVFDWSICLIPRMQSIADHK